MSARFATVYRAMAAGTRDGSESVPHDIALVRAENATFRPPHSKHSPFQTLFVGRLHQDVTDKELRTNFAQYGKILDAQVVRCPMTGTSKQYGFVVYDRERDCEYAYKKAEGSQLLGKRILVDYERGRVMPGWKPRRLGGGLGGRKESGQLRFGGRDCPFLQSRNTLTVAEEHLSRYHDDWRRHVATKSSSSRGSARGKRKRSRSRSPKRSRRRTDS